jgi:hypothetical protein
MLNTTVLDMPAVYQHVWRDHSLPSLRSLVLTVNNWEGAILLAIFAPLLAFIQERCWIIIRGIGIKIWNPVRIPDTDNPYGLERLTQIGAILSPRRIQYQSPLGTKSVPVLFQVAAIINLLAFVAIGFLVPILLTGQFSTPIVLSRDTDTCIGYEDRMENRLYTAQLADNYYKQCLYSDTHNSFCSQESGVLGSMPKLHITRDDQCPFSGNVCQDNVKPLRLEYLGLRPRDFGVNLAAKLLVDHRVTCAPLKTEEFVIVFPNNPEQKSLIWFGRRYHDPTFNSTPGAGIYGTFLRTVNGPNRYSSEYSGHLVADFWKPEPVYDLTVYPYFNEFGPDTLNENIHPYLRRDDGRVFVTMLRAGRSIYRERVHDPFYAAHEIGNGPEFYFPDYEATALGCVEQYRLCQSTADLFCTTWGSDLIQVISTYQNISSIGPMPFDLAFIYPIVTGMASMHYYFISRTGSRTLLTSVLRELNIVPFINQEEQWVNEVQAWFVTAFLNGRYSLLQIVRRYGSKPTGDEMKFMLKLCRLILFQTNSYTNVDLIGFLVSVSVLLLIWPLSTDLSLSVCWFVFGKMSSAISRAIDTTKRVPDGIHSILEEIKPVEKVKAIIKGLGIVFSTIYESLRDFTRSSGLPSFLRRPHQGEANEREANEGEANEVELNEGSRRQLWISLRFLTSGNRASGLYLGV